MRIFVASIVLLICSSLIGESCEVMSPEEAYRAIRYGNAGEAYCGIENLFNSGIESYPTLFEMLADDTHFYWFCGHSATHMRNDPIKIEPDVDLSSNPADKTAYAYQEVAVHQLTVSQVAAYITIAVELDNLFFAEYCVIYPGSERASVLNDIRILVGEANGVLLGCKLHEILTDHKIRFKGCMSNGENFVTAEMLGFDCTR